MSLNLSVKFIKDDRANADEKFDCEKRTVINRGTDIWHDIY